MRLKNMLGGLAVAIGLAAVLRTFVYLPCDYWPYCWPF